MATPFDRFGYVEAQQTVARAAALSAAVGASSLPVHGTGRVSSSDRPITVSTSVEALRRMIEGDHWLDGTGWIGPRPRPLDVGYAETMAIIGEGFISENALADVIERHINGVLGREPDWKLTVRRALDNKGKPTAAEQTLIDEAESALTEWWDARKVHAALHDLVRTLLYARRAPARLYVPRGKLTSVNREDDAGKLRTVREVPLAADITAGLAFVWPDTPYPERATVSVDEDTKESIGVVLYNAGESVTGMAAPKPRAEIVYSSGTGKTIIRQTSEGDATITSPAVLDFGGRLTMYEMAGARFITPQMIQLQRAINLTLTALGRNTVTAGWLERIIANAQTPSSWIKDEETGRMVYKPSSHITGAGTTTYLKGLEEIDESTGKKAFSTPTVTFREAATASPLVETFETYYRAMLRSAKQEHVLMAQNVDASGKAREQARVEFVATLRRTAAEVNACGRWLVETALAMAESFAGTPGRYTDTLRAAFECQIDAGPVTSSERTANDASVEAGTLSREGAMAANGVADIDAMIEQMNADPLNMLTRLKLQGEVMVLLTSAGASLEGAARKVGMTAAEAKMLVPVFSEQPKPGDPNDPNAPPAPPPPPDPTDTPPTDSGGAGGGA